MKILINKDGPQNYFQIDTSTALQLIQIQDFGRNLITRLYRTAKGTYFTMTLCGGSESPDRHSIVLLTTQEAQQFCLKAGMIPETFEQWFKTTLEEL